MHSTLSTGKALLFFTFLIAAFAVTPGKAEAVYPLGNEAVFYHFEDAATATSTNSGSTGTVNDGTFFGNASTTELFSRFGSRSASFGETGQYMRTYFGSSTNPTTSSISASMWIYKKEAATGCQGGDGDDHFFGSSGTPSGSRFYLRCATASGTWGGRFGGAAAANATTSINHQNWQHIALVFNSADDTPRIYVDGVLRVTSGVVGSFTINGDMFIGGMNDTITTPGVLKTDEFANAYMDEVAIYNAALSLSDITALYNAGDGVAPIISAIATSSITTTGATVTWTTNESASTQVEYGLTSSYTASTTLTDDVTFVTSHTASITGLSPSTEYHYRVVSRDPMGVVASSSDSTFTTAGAPDTTVPVISAVATSTASTSATITWTTDELASSQIEYGLSSTYTASTTLADTSPRVTSHSVTINGLTSSTTYHYRILTTDGSSNTASTTNATFTTTAGTPPGQPTNLAVTPYAYQAYLIWTAATSTLGDYTIEYKLSADSTWTTFSDGVSTATSTVVTGLTNNAAYDFRVIALNGATPGLVSSTVSATTFSRINFVSPTPAQSQTYSSSTIVVYASSTLPSNSFASSTHTITLANSSLTPITVVATTTRYGDYNLRHLTNTLANSDLSLVGNSSGIAYASTTDTLFIVHNTGVGGSTTIDEVTKNGVLIRALTCTSCGDIEGITLISSIASTTAPGVYDHTFMISTENSEAAGRIFRTVIPSTGTPTLNATDYFDIGVTHSFNEGLEGIAYNPASGVFYVARESSSPRLYEVRLGAGHSATAVQICGNLTWNAGITDFSDLAYNNNILYVASEDTNPSKIVPLNITSTSTCAYYDSDGDGDVSNSDTGDWLTSVAVGATDQIEGITWDWTGDTLYALGEADYLAKYRTNVFTTRTTFSGLTSQTYNILSSFLDANGVTATATPRTFTINTDVSAPFISGVGSSTASATSTFRIFWDTDELSDSKVSYGLSSGSYTLSTSSPTMVQSHNLGLPGLATSTLYYFVVVSKDGSNNIATSSERTFLTGNGSEVTAPIISSVASTTAATTATVTWTTDEAANSKVSYGLSSGTYTTSSSTPLLVTSHSIGLTGLSSDTQYFYVVVSTDLQGNTATSTEKTLLTTAGPDVTGPIISSIASTTDVTTATVTWTTNEAANSKVSYGLSSGTYTTSTSSAPTVTSHSLGLTGLSASTLYYFVAVSTDGSSNTSTSTERTLLTAAAPDITAPIISSVATSSVTDSGITVTWTTDEQASSRVAYGPTSSYNQTTAETDTSPRVTSHNVALTGLTASTLYHYAVVSRDAAGNTSTSSDATFTTSADATAPIISAVSATTTSATATITWTTNEQASSRISYGPISSYNATTSETDTSPRVTSHSVTITGLIECSTYHFAVTSRDALSNSGSGSDSTFATAGCTGSSSVDAQTASAITTASGGSVALIDGGSGLTLAAPAGFSGSNATFQISELNPTLFTVGAGSPSRSLVLVSDFVYRLSAFTSATTTVTSFAQPITITIAYSTSEISSFEESSLLIYRYDGSAWHALTGCSVNTSANTVTCTTTQFSDFALFGTVKASSGSSGSSRPRRNNTIIVTPKSNIVLATAVNTATTTTTTQVTQTITSFRLATPFVSPLYLGVKSIEVLALQKALNTDLSTMVALTGPGSPGQETTIFGPLTELAVKKLQIKYGIAKAGDPGYGYVGPKTRALLNTLFK